MEMAVTWNFPVLCPENRETRRGDRFCETASTTIQSSQTGDFSVSFKWAVCAGICAECFGAAMSPLAFVVSGGDFGGLVSASGKPRSWRRSSAADVRLRP